MKSMAVLAGFRTRLADAMNLTGHYGNNGYT